MKLVFKKAFGITEIPSDIAMLFFELTASAFKVTIGNVPVEISIGCLGRTNSEQWEMRKYVSPGRRLIERQVPTFDLSLNIAGELPVGMSEWDNRKHGTTNEIATPYIPVAYRAAKLFVDAYRETKYVQYRGRQEWKQAHIVLPRITEHDFRTFLFYTLTVDGGQTFVGSFSEGDYKSGKPADAQFAASLQKTLEVAIPPHRRFIQIAWERFFDEDFSGAIIYSAISMETSLTQLLKKELTKRQSGTKTQIAKVIKETSNRLLCTVLLGLLDIGTADLRNAMLEAFNLRNELAHGQRTEPRREEADFAIATAESFLKIAEPLFLNGDQPFAATV